RLYAQDNDSVELLVQLGTSEFFEYRIGSAAASHPFGGEPLAEEVHRSQLLRRRPGNGGSAPGGSGGGWGIAPAFSLRVLSTLFTREHRQLQVVSFRDRERNGPAFSKAVTVMIHGLDTTVYDRGLPARASSLYQGAPSSRGCRRVSIGFSESGLSHAQFVDSLLGALQALAPSLLEALPDLIAAISDDGSDRDGVGGEGSAANGPSSGLDSGALLGLLRQLVEHIPGALNQGESHGAVETSAGPPPPPPAPPPPGGADAADSSASAVAGEQ